MGKYEVVENQDWGLAGLGPAAMADILNNQEARDVQLQHDLADIGCSLGLFVCGRRPT